MITWAFDIDEVLSDFSSSYIEIANQYLNTKLTRNDLYEYHLETVLGVDRNIIQPIIDLANSDENIELLPIILDAMTLFKKLKRIKCSIYIVTARDIKMKTATMSWLDKHELSHDGLYMTAGEDKSKILNSLGVKYFIEDNLFHAIPAATSGIKVFCPKYPWNTNRTTHNNITMIDTCADLLEKIDATGNIK